MKKYRCPWCGKKGVRKNFNLPLLRYRAINLTLLRFRAFRNTYSLCENCNRPSETVPAKKLLIYDISLIVGLIFFMVLLILQQVFNVNIYWLFYVLVGALLISSVILFIRGCRASVLIRTKDSVRLTHYMMQEPYGDTEIQTQFLALLDKPLNLNVENIFTIRLKDISPQKIMAKPDLIGEYNQDGAPIYVEHQENNDYRIGMLNPLYYNLDVFAPDVEFDVYDTEGKVISTGRIIRSLG